MKTFNKVTHYFTYINRLIVAISLALLMPIIALFGILRTFNYPVVGDVEITQLSMVVLIMGALAYTEKMDQHIAIGIIVDRFPEKVQTIFSLVAQFATLLFCILVCWTFITKFNMTQSSTLLGIPFYPFKLLIILGFTAWGLEVISKIHLTLTKLKRVENKEAREDFAS